MKTATVDLVWSYPASRHADGRLACNNGGDIDWWFRQSMRLAIPDSATAEDVKNLGWNYLYEAAHWLQVDWEPIGDSEDGNEYHSDYSVVLTADDPAKAHATLVYDDVTGALVFEDEGLHEQAMIWVEAMQECREANEDEGEDKTWLDPWKEESEAKGLRPLKETWEQQDRWKFEG